MFFNEYDNYSFLSPEDAFRTRWTVYRTMIHVSEKNEYLAITTISFPSGLSGFIYGIVALSFTLIYGLYSAFSEGRIEFLVGFCFFYVVSVLSANEAYRDQNEMIRQVIHDPETNQ